MYYVDQRGVETKQYSLHHENCFSDIEKFILTQVNDAFISNGS